VLGGIVVFLILQKIDSFTPSVFVFFANIILEVLVLIFLGKFKIDVFAKVRKVKLNFWLIGLLVCIVGLFSNAFTVFLLFTLHFPWTQQAEPLGPNFLYTSSIGGVHVAWLLDLWVLAPIIEEFLHRKYMYGLFVRKSVPMASVLTALFFMVGHPIDTWRSLCWIIDFFLFALQANYLYAQTGRIIFPILMHISANCGVQLIRPWFISNDLTVFQRHLLLGIGVFVFFILLIWLNVYLKMKIGDIKITREKTDQSFNWYCYALFGLFFFLSWLWI